MARRISILRLLLSATVVAAAAVFSAGAQQSDQPIIFSGSSSANSSSANILSAPKSSSPDLSKIPTVVSPSSGNNNSGGFGNLSGSPNLWLNQHQQKTQEKKYWTLMTPEEILGVQTPEQILGLPDPDADKSQEQRFLDRQQAAANAAAANSLMPFGSSLSGNTDNPFSLANLRRLAGNSDLKGSSAPDNLDNGSSPPPNSLFGKQQQGSMWTSVFNVPTVASQPAQSSQKQISDMDRFRALLGSVTPKPAAKPLAQIAQSPSLNSSITSDDDNNGLSQWGKPQDFNNRWGSLSQADKLAKLKEISMAADSYTAEPKRKEPLVRPAPWTEAGYKPPKTPTWKY
jgi:hypothetical protein